MKLRFVGQDMDPSELIRRLPACYSSEFDACINEFEASVAEKREPKLTPFCQQYYALWRATPAMVWDAAMESMPYCSPPAQSAKNLPLWFLGVGFGGILLGTLIR